MKVIACLILVIALCGCANVKGETVTGSNKEQILTDIGKSSMTDDEKKYFLAATLRSAIGNYSLDGKSVGQIIADQKAYQADQDAQAAAAHEAQLKAEAARAALISQMQHAISVQPLTKRYIPSDYENGVFDDHVVVNLQFHNVGNKAIKGVKGSLQFTNSFGDKVIKLNFEAGGGGSDALSLSPNYVSTQEFGWKYNQFESKWQKFRDTPLSSMKAEWVPETILFGDGSVLKAPDDSGS